MNGNRITDNELNVIATLLEDIVTQFVSSPEKVFVKRENLGTGGVLKLCIAAGDMSRVIGSRGKHFYALKDLVEAYGAMVIRHPVELAPLDEPQTHRKQFGKKFEPREDWDKEKIIRLTERIARASFRDDQCIEVSCRDEQTQSILDIHISESEPMRHVSHMAQSIQTLVNLIAKGNGRVVFTNVMNDLKPDPQQEQVV